LKKSNTPAIKNTIEGLSEEIALFICLILPGRDIARNKKAAS